MNCKYKANADVINIHGKFFPSSWNVSNICESFTVNFRSWSHNSRCIHICLKSLWRQLCLTKWLTNHQSSLIFCDSEQTVGLDVQSTYTPFYSGPKHLRAIVTETSHAAPQPPKNTKQDMIKRRQPAVTNQWLGYDSGKLLLQTIG